MTEVAGAGTRLALALLTVMLASGSGQAQAWGSRSYFVSVHEPGSGAVRLFVEERGAGKPIVLLHGIGASTYGWRKVAPGLAATHRVIAVDLKGFGRSAKPGNDRYRARDQARLMEGVLVALDLKEVTLVGHSFGGTVALALLMRGGLEASRIERVVLIDAPAFPQPWPAAAELASVPGAAEVGLTVTPPELLVSLALSQALKRPSAVTDADISAYARPLYDPGAREALVETLRHLMATDFATAARAYRRIALPVLVIWCRSDPLVPLRTGVLLARALPNARLAVEDGCGHIPIEETPRQVVSRISEFVR
jgi:pimeloyl-ACP methyl ester carboxylesterase